MLNFLKKNGYYIMLAVCVICIGVMIALAITYNAKFEELRTPTPTPMPSNSAAPVQTPTPSASPTPSPSLKPVDAEPITFAVPVNNATVGMDYAIDSFVFSETLNQWQTHTGIDFITQDSQPVYAAADGKVVDVVTDDILSGNTVIIDHGNGLKSYYMSLAAEIPVSVGEDVKCGDAVGATSMSGYEEFKEGCHLHYEMTLNDELVDPKEYFALK